LPGEGTGSEETAMTDPEREHFVRQIRDLESRLRVWRLACLVLLGLLLLPVVLGGLLGVWWVPRLEGQRALLEAERERALQAEMEARSERNRAEQVLREAEEKAQQRQGPGENKD
jgi:hypothetical protein